MSELKSHILRLENWSVRREKNVHIESLNFQLTSGDIVTLMGPSGVGKTTFLMALLGYEDLALEIRGHRYNHGQLLKRRQVPRSALYIPQHLPFNPNWELASFLCRLPWGIKSWRDLLFPRRLGRSQQVDHVLRELGLEHRARATVAQLSGGETQRAALAQMLLLKPELLIGDEFVSALDPGLSTSILNRFAHIVKDTGGAAILALHNVEAALQISNRILIVWPPRLSPTPWIIERKTFAWRSDVLYTILCLARWIQDIPDLEGISLLIEHVYSWLRGEFSPRHLLNGHAGLPVLVYESDGSIRTGSDLDEQDILKLIQGLEERKELSLPFQEMLNGSTYTGLGIALDENSRGFLLARTQKRIRSISTE